MNQVDRERYQRLVGTLIYLSPTCFDIAYAVSVLNQFMHNSRSSRLEAAIALSAPGKGILFSRLGHLKLEAYTDADSARTMEGQSISGDLGGASHMELVNLYGSRL